jgi:transcriptional antiterminator NusG
MADQEDKIKTPVAEETVTEESVAVEAVAEEAAAEEPAAEEAAAEEPVAEEAAAEEPVAEEAAAEEPAAEEAAAEEPVAEEPVAEKTVAAEPVAEQVAEAVEEAEAPEAAKQQNPNQRWYVVHAYSGFESYVKKVLESRIAASPHKGKFGDIMVPTEEVVEMREGSRRKSERKFFPGYVLVQMEMDNDTWHMVKEVPKVLGFIGGTSDKPAPITEAEADAILNRVEEGVDRPRPKVLFEVGEVVRVNDGPFNDFNGVVEEVNYEKSKMLVSVQIFGRSTPVELAFGQVEKG